MPPIRRLGLVGLSLLALVNAPSLKLIVGNTPLVNLGATAALGAVVGLLVLTGEQVRIELSESVAVAGLGLACLGAVVPMLLSMNTLPVGFAGEALRFVYIIVVFVLVLVGSRRTDGYVFVWGQILWGNLVSLLFLVGVIQLGGIASQHYNTVTLPVGTSSTAILLTFMSGAQIGVLKRVGLVALLLLNFACLLNLYGRSPFVFVVAIVLIISVVRHRGVIRKVKEGLKGLTLLLTGGAAVALLVSYAGIPVATLLLSRLGRLLGGGASSESRLDIYAEAVALVQQSPFGYGFGAYPALTQLSFDYPHNFLLEMGVAGGVVPSFILAAVVAWVLLRAVRAYRAARNPVVMYVGGLCLYYFFTFMLSYALNQTYIMFASMALLVVLARNGEEPRTSAGPSPGIERRDG
jgi:O-antigen ligase